MVDARIREKIDRVMMDEFELEPADMRPEALLKDDLDIDSLDGLDLLLAMNKAFNVKVPEERMQGIRTLQDVYDVAAQVIAEQTSGAASIR